MNPLLDESFLRQLETLNLMAQKGVKGDHTGIHRSCQSGNSMEFMDYRKYQPGDDIRYVDWNVYGRTDRLFVKLFHAEKDLTLHIIMDTSKSMQCGRPDKLLYAQKIVAAIGYLGLANQDQVSICSFNDTLGPIGSPERGKDVYLSILDYLSTVEARGKTDVNAALTSFAMAGHKPGIVVVVSDMLDPSGYTEGVKALFYARFKVSVIQVLAPEEIEPELSGRFLLEDMEAGRHRSVNLNKKMKIEYTKKMTAYLEGIKGFCKTMGVDYHLANTRFVFEDFFLGYLGSQQQLP